MYRPAGFSDDDDDDDDDEFETGLRNRRRTSYAWTTRNNGGPKSVYEAILLKNLDILLKAILLSKSKNISLDYDLVTKEVPLILACINVWSEGVKLLLEHGANPNVQKELITPLAMCCYSEVVDDSQHAECVTLLLQYGADPNIRDQLGRTALLIAAQKKLGRVLDALLECPRTDIHAVDPAGWTALFFAMQCNDQVAIRKLLAAGLDPNVRAYNLTTAQDLLPSREEVPFVEDVLVEKLFQETFVRDHYDIDLFEDNLKEKKLEEFFSLLPDADGRGGFRDCVKAVLEGAGCTDVELQQAQLPDVLCGDEQLLTNLGVKFAYNRYRILKEVHRFHFTKWEKSSVQQISQNEELTLDRLGNIVGGLLHHLVMMRAAVSYLHSRLEPSPPDPGTSRRETVTILVSLYTAQATLRHRLLTLLQEIEKVKDFETNLVNYVRKGENRNPAWKCSTSLKVISAALVIFGASYFYFFRL